MRPLELTLRGFTGIRAGLGRDEITVDLARIVGDAELVAIAGPNGRGKTTIIDNLHPFPVMPSHAGADGLGAFSYYDHLCLPEGLKDLVWEHEGVRYRSQWVFRLNGKRRTDSFLHVWRGEGWVPVQLLDGTMSDGKADTYLRCVEGIIGSAETFFTSAFSAQNRRPLASYRNGEIKTLLADLLGLDQIREIGSRAAETVRLIKNGLVLLRQQRAGLQSESDGIAARVSAAGDVAAQVASAAATRDACQLTLDQAKAEVVARSAARDAAAQTEVKREELTVERAAVIAGGKSALAALEEQDRREQARGQQLDRRIARRHEAARQNRIRLLEQQRSHEASLRLAAKIALAACQLVRTEQIVVRREEMVDELRGQAERLQALKADQVRLLDRMAALEREAGQAALKAEDLARRFRLTREVPCSGTALQGQCQLLSDAREAKPLLPSATLTVVRLRTERGQVETELNTLAAEIKSRDSIPERLAIVERKLRRSRGSLARLSQLAARQEEIQKSQESMGRIADELAGLAAELGVTAEEQAEREDIAAARSAIAERRQEESARYRALLDRADASLAMLPARFDDCQLRVAEGAAEAARRALAEADGAYLQAVREQYAMEQAQSRKAVVTTELGGLDARLRYVEAAIGKWTLFARCMGNDGIIALSIDDAGPTLTALANKLLLACYGPRFTVSIKTQVETAKGEAREGFDIVVHDAETGDCKSVALMSGGVRIPDHRDRSFRGIVTADSDSS